MQAHTVERVESWDSRPFSDGFRELHGLADREFSGAVVADGTWLFMLNGRVIGVYEGDIEDFGDASGTVYEAPDPSLALLFSMQERGGKTQAKYYTNDTPLSEADKTLADANFTGYIELSENVLSGDYYVVYYGGRSMSAAFVGTTEELLTGDEAFERADDEVGVYEVKKTPVNVTSIPEIDDGDDAAGGAAGAGGAAAGASAADEAADSVDSSDSDSGTDEGGESASESAGEPSSESDQESPGTAGGRTESSSDARASGAREASESAGPTDDPTATDAETRTESDTAGERTTDTPTKSGRTATGGKPGEAASSDDSSARARSTKQDHSASTSPSDRGGPNGGDGASSSAPAGAAEGEAGGESERVFDEEEEWRNATSVPTLDPEKSESTDGGATSSNKRTKRSQQRSKTTKTPAKSGQSPSKSESTKQSRSTVEKLKVAVKRRDAKLEEASERIQELERERDDLQARVESLQSERDELRERADDLQSQLDAAEQADESATEASGPDLTPEAALSGTNLFVRYGSKGKATLDGLDGSTDPDAVNKNLRVDHHTQFDATEATVDGEDYETFLESTGAYRFVSWAVRELPYEIRDAGHTNGLDALYTAIPDVDRAELDGSVEVETEEGTTTRSFDVVLRDRMGDPLVVAELNAEREPVTGVEMDDLVDAATTVREGVDELSAAMYVTASFFEPAALETASEETANGGFLSRSDRESFVNVGRKAGYHLCLVEDRNDAFHLTVPEL
ncbi:DUF7527 domain-containing protein [Halobacterium bonnevillei]|uniref:DUF7527 domain-containing protein n=1 Tax=Halobacterium bonnevillei TaxID=2692200 RepID=A0A6B0SVW6_9EURY|nr:hypothetical protein [Halobacterium bonnevillei]MXR21629.1 hypothetical protein [Halobacterium bonnevillei]